MGQISKSCICINMHSEFTQVIDLQKWRHWNVWWWRRAGTGFVEKTVQMCVSIGLRVLLFLHVFVSVCVYFCVCFVVYVSKTTSVFSTDRGSRVLSSDNSFYFIFFVHWAPLMKYHQYQHCKQSILRNSFNLKGFLKWILVSICGQKALEEPDTYWVEPQVGEMTAAST